MRLPRAILWFMLLTVPATNAAMLPGDAANGKKLHDSHCLACHDQRVYTRPAKRVKSIEGLMGQVRQCNQQLKTNLQREQLNDLVKYLNDTYYRFP